MRLCEIRLNQLVLYSEEIISTEGIHLTPHEQVDRVDFVFVALFRSYSSPFDFPVIESI